MEIFTLYHHENPLIFYSLEKSQRHFKTASSLLFLIDQLILKNDQ